VFLLLALPLGLPDDCVSNQHLTTLRVLLEIDQQDLIYYV